MSSQHRRIAFIGVLALVLATVSACSSPSVDGDDGGGDGTRVMRVHGDLPGPFWMSEVVQDFTDGVNADSNAALDLSFYPAAALGIPSNQILKPVADGQVEFAQVTVGQVSGTAPYLDFAGLPMMFDSTEEARAAMEESLPILQDQLKEHLGVRILAYGVSTPVHLFMRDKDYTGTDSLEGLRIRTPSAVVSPWIESFGGSPTTLANPEIPEALSTNQLDAVFNSLASNLTSDLKQWGSNVLMINASVAPVLLVTGEATWNSLSKQEQEVIQQKADALTDAWFTGAVEQEKNGITDSQSAGYELVDLPDADRESLRALAQRTWTTWADGIPGDIGHELLDIATSATGSK
jgi:TRAP-type C4-dicarboxylate transport system substrate-binding protein